MSHDAIVLPRHVLSVLLDERLVTFTRVVGLLRRRRISPASLAVGPAAPGLSRLTALLAADGTAAERGAEHLRKVVGVREVVVFPASERSSRELALIKVRPPDAGSAELLEILRPYHCTIVDEADGAVTLEVSGPEAVVRSCLRALEHFRVVEVARTGTIALAAKDRRAGYSTDNRQAEQQ